MSDDIERLLSSEESSLGKDNEISRILACCEWDYFAVLDIDPKEHEVENLPNVVKKVYRRKTLLIHPDKTTNSDAPAAFDRLKKAELVLGVPLSSNSENTSDKALVEDKKRLIDIYRDWQKDPGLELDVVRKNVAIILNDEIKQENIEKLYKQRQEASRMAEIKRVQEERAAKKRMESKWEDERDVRVSNWREYANRVEKKGNKKKNKKGVGKKKVLA
ncbi:uncharacterized protein RJT20DRAFT_124005 [Scheffersomyces xylosifermentans]|uniref:uncharacterized protein n=1 Tax=Scheffersomyces xylosifermentans TaxID=1304137 RepID=UPI00315CC0A3